MRELNKKKTRSIWDIPSRPKRKKYKSYEVYVKFKDTDSYKYINTCKTSKTYTVGDEYIKEDKRFKIVDIDKDVLFYKEI